jgi:hypothetical protein
MMNKTLTFCFALFFSLSYGLAAGPASSVGQVIATSVSIDGVDMPSGTAVLDRAVVKTSKDEPAVIHLDTGDVLHLHRGSAAYFEKVPSGQVLVSLRSGTISYRAVSGAVVSMPSDTAVSFPQRQAGERVERDSGVSTTEDAQEDENVIQVNDASRINSKLALLIRSADGRTQEIHYVEAIVGNSVRLTARLRNAFGANSVIIQVPETVSDACAGGTVVVGAAGGASQGSPAACQPGARAGMGVAGVVAGVGGGATAVTLSVLAANGVFSSEEGGGAPPMGPPPPGEPSSPMLP